MRDKWHPAWLASGVFACALLASLTAWADPTDPFSPENKAPERKAKAQPEPEKKLSVSDRAAQVLARKMDLKLKLEPAAAQPGQVVKLIITGVPSKDNGGAYTYPVTLRAPEQSSSILSQIMIGEIPGVKSLWPIEESRSELYQDSQGDVKLVHKSPFTWSQDLLILPDAKPGTQTVEVKVKLQVCDKDSCTFHSFYPILQAPLEILAADKAVALAPELKSRLAMPPPPVGVVELPAELQTKKSRPAAPGNDPKSATTTSPGSAIDLLGLLGAAFTGAFLMLLTPCVFPMIPITVNFFLKQSEKEHHRPFFLASVYSGTIVVLLTLVMLVLGKVVINLANNAWFNLALGGALIFFALSLFGMYEIELPSGLARFTSAREGQGGVLGAVFMALTFTITSFTCTGPFLGALLAPVASLRPPPLHLLLASVVYAATFAAPFFVLALFPSMLKKLPKSGSWMNAIKVTMGFLEIGAALKFLSNTDMAFFPGNPRLFNYETVLCAWIALSIACGLYLFGLFRLPHDDAVDHIGVVRMLFASIFIGLAVYIMPALFGTRPQGIIGENLVAFLPPNFKRSIGVGERPGQEHLAWHLDYKDAWKEAVQSKKLIFIDFTGVNCTNCRDNEENVFPVPRVRDLLQKYARLQLYTDSVPNPSLSKAESDAQAERNQGWQDQLAQDLTNPTYLIFEPDPQEPLKDGKPNGRVLGKTKGKVFSVDQFVQFLESPIANGSPALSWHRTYEDAWKEAVRDRKPMLIDFTAITSTNARSNEVEILTKPAVSSELQSFSRARLATDYVNDAKLSETERRKQGERHLDWQLKLADSHASPVYLILVPDSIATFQDDIPKGKVLNTIEGRLDEGQMVQFLRKTREDWARERTARID